MSRPNTPTTPTLEEQLQSKREQIGFRPPKIVERTTSQKQAAVRQLKESGKYTTLGRGRKSRKLRKSRRRLTRRR
jgi:hypothetical protein